VIPGGGVRPVCRSLSAGRGRVWLAGFVLLGLAMMQPAAASEWRALVIGIDAYENIAPLNGAVNDARDIENTLRAAGVSDLVALHDQAASRTAVLEAWQALVSRAGPDDVLVLSFAGHGAQEKEWIAGSEADGFDEVFLLAGFDVSAPGNGERLRDDDVAAMLQAAGSRNVLVLADSCHSGTMTRSIDPRIVRLGTRLVGLPDLENDVLRSAPAHPVLTGLSSARTDAEDRPNVIYVGATVDGQVIPELMIGGQPRGALSWAFARGVEGRADLDRDGGISMDELARFLKETVRVATEGRQFPSLHIGAGSRAAVMPRVDEKILVRGRTVLTVAAKSETAGLVLRRLAERRAGRFELVREGTADLFWDDGEGDVLNKFGDIVLQGEARDAERFEHVVTKWVFLADLAGLSRSRVPIEASLKPAVGHIREGAPVRVALASDEDGYMAVFALEADGTLRLLAPDKRADPLGKDTFATAGEPYRLNLRAARPFGADHIVMVRARKAMPQLVGVLAALDGQILDPDLAPKVLRLIERNADAIGITSVYTQPAG